MVNIYEEAIYTFGVDKQIDCVIEECLELALVLQQRKRKKVEIAAVIDELVDVEIMVKQLRVILKEDEAIFTRKSQKLARLLERINDHKKKVRQNV